ncbi:MalM family protein [Psychromonas sp.]|uniref:MalM family protein n=1 Tax=Psychromonas sp. TaxID=1884585 RepID=UPI00356A577D
MKNLWFVILAVLLAACSSTDNFVSNSFGSWDRQFANEAKLTAQLRSPQAAPVSLNRLEFQMLSLESNNRIDITADSPIVNFPEGNSYTAALFLPEHINRFTFVLQSDAGRTVFVPSVIFLDENLQEVSRIDNAQFNPKGFFSVEKVFTGEISQAIRYIVVYSKDSVLDGRSERLDPAREYELKKGKELPEQSFPKLYSKHSPIGQLELRFEDVFFSAQSISKLGATEEIRTFKPATPVKAPTILSDTEAFYLEQISKAVKENNLSRALSLVDEAERAGSKKAKSHYRTELGKQ